MVDSYYYGFDWTYILVVIGGLISLWASSNVKSTFKKYSRIRSVSGLTGAEAARRLLKEAGIYDVSVEHIKGHLTDHYDPKSKVLRLSDSVYGSDSIAAISVAAHECGHAMQHDEDYEPLKIRSAIVPAANFGSRFGIYIVIAGVLLSYFQPLITLGIILFSFGMIFQLVTLPVEFNASARALSVLKEKEMLVGDENTYAYKVLKAAALTYVAAAAASFLSLMRLILRYGGKSKER
ncbi:MAG: zinc metallopeptidase [Lachnospiraceae bacterium]|nr:zinc metallopeptidase [Lachnospiraceae bacterium]